VGADFLDQQVHLQYRFEQNAPVAQRIERQPPELKAAGSNPAGRTNNIKDLENFLSPFF
jgi:hypothetical protein